MKNPIIFLILMFFTNGFVFGQPGYYGSFEFKIFNNEKLVDLSDSNWKVITYKNSNSYPTHSYKYPDYYRIEVSGGSGKEDLYVDLVFNSDTMRIYTPSINFRTVTLDSIAFKKGIFKIPTHLYDLKDLLKKTPNYKYIPNIKGNWDLFSTKKEVYKCYIEKIEDLDNISSPSLPSENGNTMIWKSSTQFNCKKNYIIKYQEGYDRNNQWNDKHLIYEIKNIVDTTFWGGKIKKYEILSLYAKENTLFGLIKKSYSDFNRCETYGVYKLNFVDEERITEKLATFLRKQQIEEDYNSAMKLRGYGETLREKIKLEYNKTTK